MQKTGIIRQVDELGRFVIPKELRISMGIVAKDPLELRVLGDGGIALYKHDPAMSLSDSVTHLKMRVHENDMLAADTREAALQKLSELEGIFKRRERL
ncbi:Transition state regulatory protein AbrB [bioreactor metagenome]|uniref:Transition state regulatory protein AbrB n=1 Tax=bioreactor metagenome TaxID=1076179 RepID=A0A645JLH3_9ZZZZ